MTTETIREHLEHGDRDGLIEMLALELRSTEIARQMERDPGGIASSDTPRGIAADVLDSDWLFDILGALVEALARRPIATGALEEFAVRVRDVRRPKPEAPADPRGPQD